jgi:predicted nucleotidyltransferase component of viral defense system
VTQKEKTVKVDVNYTDKFIFPAVLIDTIRMASIEEIAAMKLEVILGGGRIKDFWDLHELADHFTFKQMIKFHEKRYHTSYSLKEWKIQMQNFAKADPQTQPECLRGKHWELIKLDLIDFVN